MYARKGRWRNFDPISPSLGQYAFGYVIWFLCLFISKILKFIFRIFFSGGDKIQDAYYIYQELIDKHGATPLLLNGQSASYIGQEKFDEAEAALQEAVEKDPNNVDTLINLIVLAQQTGKSTEVNTVKTVNYAVFSCMMPRAKLHY